jgi:hypothetical protein
MTKFIRYLFLFLILFFTGLTVFGPWKTYRTQTQSNIYVNDCPIWFGWILEWTTNTVCQEDELRP